MSKAFTPTPHPVLALPTPEQSITMGQRAWETALMRREEIVRAERNEPFEHLWEPPIWQVADALLEFPWVDKSWAARMRARLGFPAPVRQLLILGGQRGGKTQWLCSRCTRVLRWRAGANTCLCHSNLAMSREYHQGEMFKYLPAYMQAKNVKSKTAYVAYTQKNGFTEESFVMPVAEGHHRGSTCSFKTYEQDKRTIEGGNFDFIGDDELVPVDWVTTQALRIAERAGWLAVGFTPVEGYTETVRHFVDGAAVAMEAVNFLCPKDGGEPLLHLALGLTLEQLRECEQAEKDGRAACFPQSIPQDCNAWLEGRTGQPEIPAGREFEIVPRVLRCVDTNCAAVFFHSADNPYGNPRSVWATIKNRNREFIRERWAGVANKVVACRFPKFSVKSHVVDPAVIPVEGTNYHFVDPTGGRNFFMCWFRVTPEHVYVTREWPGPYYIEGRGVPGPWALPDGKKLDGRPGPAQDTFGWGLRDYKKQIAALEQWKDAAKPIPHGVTTGEWIDGWDERNGAVEVVQERYMDSRFASEPKMEKDRPVTLLTDFEEMHMYFTPTPGDDINEGVQQINDALNYDEKRDVDFFNKPRLLISSACPNLIFALQTWTGRDGNKGATKDPIDLLRYFLLSDCPYLGGSLNEDEEEETEPGARPVRKYY